MSTRRGSTWLFVSSCSLVLAGALVAPALAASIHAGDSLYVTVWNHPELSKAVAVDADGGVRIPLSGVVAVGGLNESTAATKIADSLRPYVQYPAVSVETTTEGTTLFVSGGPVGVLKYQSGETLEAAISDEMQQTPLGAPQELNAAGESMTKSRDVNAELRSRIDLHAVKLERDDQTVGVYDTVALSAQGESGPILEPGDRIVFRYKAIQVDVRGEVAQPGPTYLSSDESLSDAVTQAGGLLPTSSSSHIVLQRNGQAQVLAYGDPVFTQPAQAGDVITIPTAPRVTVVGMVATPGVVTLKSDSTLLSAVYTAGGPVRFADLGDVEIVHGDKKVSYNITALTHGDMSQNPELHDGDTVLVPRNHAIDFTPFYNVLGAFAGGLSNHVF